MEDNKKIPESNEDTAEKTEAGTKKPLPKSTIIVGAISAVIIIALTVALILSLGSKKPDGGSGDSQGDTAPTVTVDEDGFVVVNGTKTEYKVDTEKHTFGEWTLYNEGETDCAKKIYRRTCSDCSTLEWKEGKYEDHVWDTEYISDASQHWKKCKNCAVLTAKEDHTEGDEGICTLCDAPLGDTAGIAYGVSPDGTYAEVLGYDGTANKVKIASEYNGLPVKTIYSEAFIGNNTITSVIIPDSVTSIGNYAFYGCYSLVSVVIGDSVESIGDDAFHGCSSLVSVVIPDSVESIGYNAFYRCDSLESVVIPDSVKSIGSYAFYGCSKLTSVVIPDSVTSIGSTAFSRCDSLVSVVIGDSVTSIGSSAFSWCISLESVVIPDNVTSIGSSAFSYCDSALYTEYEYGKYVKSGDNPYAVLIEVTNKNFSTYTIHEDTKIIANSAFSDCSRLTSITIPDSVTSISGWAFANCTSLESVVIGDSVTSIGEYAFSWCTSLESVVIPDSVTSIGDSAFNGCSALKDVYYTGTEEEWGQISIGSNNSYLTSATKHFNYVPEE